MIRCLKETIIWRDDPNLARVVVYIPDAGESKQKRVREREIHGILYWFSPAFLLERRRIHLGFAKVKSLILLTIKLSFEYVRLILYNCTGFVATYGRILAIKSMKMANYAKKEEVRVM